MTMELKNGPFLGQRHLQTLLLFLAIVVNYYTKLNASVAVVALTNAETTNPDFPEYDWTEIQKSLIISSFFWGYFVTQFPGGYMCRRFGTRAMMFISTLGSATLALILPLAIDRGGWQAYCGIRIVQGLFQGVLYPCVYAHLAAWCPPSESNLLGALASMGVESGTVLSMFLSGKLATSSMGWPGIFYMSSIMGGVWCTLWFIFSANSPSESKFILPIEKNFIENAQNALKKQNVSPSCKKTSIPWRAIFTSGPFLASLVAAACESWGFYTLQAEIPAYMNGVFGMDMETNTLFSALPYLAMMCMSYIFLIASQVVLRNNLLSLNALRKTFNSLAFWLPAAGLIALSFLGEEHKTMAVVMMTVSVGLNAGNTIGSSLNTIDLSPNYAGILMGINNTFATFIPIITPLFVGLILKDEADRSAWQIIFLTAALFFIVGNLIFFIFGSTNLQPWDDDNFLVSKTIQNEECNKDHRIFKEII